MLNTKAAILVRQHRAEVARIDRVRRFSASPRPLYAHRPPIGATPTTPQVPPIVYAPDLSAVPQKMIDKLRKLIASIERRDASTSAVDRTPPLALRQNADH